MGRTPICACGYIKAWHGQTFSSENSQHLTDWYTPSHVLHGLILYALLGLVGRRRLSLGARLVIARLVEAAWEIAENTDAVIERYRAATIELDYHGDSMVNSLADIGAMWLGFGQARMLPVPVSLVLFVAAEALTTWPITEGLMLDVLMLIWPIEAVRAWQSAV